MTKYKYTRTSGNLFRYTVSRCEYFDKDINEWRPVGYTRLIQEKDITCKQARKFMPQAFKKK